MLKKDHLEPFKIALMAMGAWLAWIVFTEMIYEDTVTIFTRNLKSLISMI